MYSKLYQKIYHNPNARSPTLHTILMVEKIIKIHSGKYDRTDLWKHLPKKVMWQTFMLIIEYLEESKKIKHNNQRKLIYIWNKKRTKKQNKSFNWHDIVEQIFKKRNKQLKEMDKLVKNSTLTESDAEQIGHKIKAKILKRFIK